MAEIRCPKCGRNNPDLLDVCQFCQTPLKSDSVLRIGQVPTKKDTGELEAILPDWLRDVRQQARSSAEEEAAQEAALPKVEKNEPPDLLAGLVSKSSDAGDDDIPDWLASINPIAGPKPVPPSAPEPESDFFAQFKQSEAAPAREPVREDIPPSPDHAPVPSSDSTVDELSQWFSEASEQPEEIVEVNPDAQRQGEAAWTSGFDSPLPSQPEPAPKEEEDLSWLHNLEEVSKQTGDLQAPKQNMDWVANFETPSAPSATSGSQEDLSWLDNLGGIEESQQPAAAQPFDAAPEKPASVRPFVSDEDLSWLGNLGGAAESAQPAEAAPGIAPSSQDDLSWLKDLGGPSEPSQPVEAAPKSSSQDDLSWLNELGGQSGAQYTPPFAEPESTAQAVPPYQAPPTSKKEEVEPDWLKSALEPSSMPAAGDESLEQVPPAGTPQPAPGEPESLANQDLDSLFSAEMPDWLSRSESAAQEPAAQEAAPAPVESAESLAPVDLPSWVQAMRPVEAVISETASGMEDEPAEKEGPLAGLRGVIPGMAIGSSIRPKAVALKLQATNEQQASATLLEQILGSETNPRTLITPSFVWSQRWLRWVLAGLFWVVLGVIIALRSNIMPVSADLPAGVDSIPSALMGIPANANVLVVIDYEPALAGEMEATGGPLLDHMVLLGHPQLSFLSTSPNGAALVERLLTNAKITSPASDGGFEYQAGTQYCNLGFLPGGAAGTLGFIKSPNLVIPSTCGGVTVGSFSDYDAVILMTDHAESGRVWVEQLYVQRQANLALNQPLFVVASAQAGPLLQPYMSSKQIAGMISGLSDAARYEYKNALPPGIARSYWDAFGIGLAMAIALIVLGSLWSLFTGIRARRAEAEQG